MTRLLLLATLGLAACAGDPDPDAPASSALAPSAPAAETPVPSAPALPEAPPLDADGSDDASGGRVEAITPDDLEPAPSGVQARIEPAPEDLAPPLVGTLVAVAPGEPTCTLTVSDAAGTEAAVAASPELCGPPDLTGQRVRLAYEKISVLDESCGDDPACPDVRTILLAVGMAPDA